MYSTIIFTVLLFIIPLLFFSIKSNILSNISLKNLTSLFNKSLLIQFLEGLILMMISKSFDHELGHYENIKFYEKLFLETSLYYVIIGLFYYIPFVIIINIVNFMNLKLKK